MHPLALSKELSCIGGAAENTGQEDLRRGKTACKPRASHPELENG